MGEGWESVGGTGDFSYFCIGLLAVENGGGLGLFLIEDGCVYNVVFIIMFIY